MARSGSALPAIFGGLLASALSAATFTVNDTGDAGDADTNDGVCATAGGVCTLRAAIEQANALPGADTIAFNIPGPGVHTITPATFLPVLADDAGVTIDGYTQPGSSPNTLAIGNDAILTIEIDGSLAIHDGLTVRGAYATIRGLVINRFAGDGIAIRGGYGHHIGGCFLGTNPTGTLGRGNQTGLVIEIVEGTSPTAASDVLPSVALIGGLDVSDRNLISGNSYGLVLGFGATNCLVQNNYIGTDASGEAALPNQTGVTVLLLYNIIGGCNSGCPGQHFPGANVISGNASYGISFGFVGPNYVSGNLIGTDATGMKALPNGGGIVVVQTSSQSIFWNVISGNLNSGVRIFHADGTTISGNFIGTNIQGTGSIGNGGNGVEVAGSSVRNFVGTNTIAYNGGAGVSIGADLSDGSNDNSIYSNSIHDNSGLGIDLGNDGVTPNNKCDPGRGPNLLQNAPVLTSAVPDDATTSVRGVLNSIPNASFYIQFFSSPLCDPSGYGEGETYIPIPGGDISVTSDASCNASFEAVLPVALPLGSVVTAVARDGSWNTSEFSACQRVTTGLDLYTITPCRVADTRDPPGPFGGPSLSPEIDRLFTVAGRCGVPSDASAVAFNFTVTQPETAGNLQIFPGTAPLPVPPAVYYSAGQTRATNGILALDAVGRIGTHVTQSAGTVDFVIDATGYFR